MDDNVFDELRAEIERLRGLADSLADDVERLRPYASGVRCPMCDHLRLELGEAKVEIERLRGLVDACAIYLKEDETPAQRIERERADTEAVLKLLLKEKREIERLREDNEILRKSNRESAALR